MYDKINYAFLPELMVNYLHYMSGVKNKSSKTIYEYALNLKMFFQYVLIQHNMTDEKDISDKIIIKNLDIDFFNSVSLDDAYAFMSYCKDVRGNSPASRKLKASAIRSFFNYLYVRKLINENPMQNLDSPKLKKTLPKYLTLEQSLDLLNCIDGKNKERDYAIIVLFLNCGMRLSELVGLDYKDIKSNRTMVVTGKGNKERTIYLNDACIDAVEAYMKVRPKDHVIDREALFLSSRLKRISPKTVQYIVKQFLEKAGLDGYSVHKLRHTAATLMYQYGNTDVLVLKEILGHENVGTTQIYTHVVNSQLEEAAEANPLSKVTQKKDSDGK